MAERTHDQRMTLRLTEQEYDWLTQLAQSAGLTHSDWLRQAIRKAAEKLKK